MKLDKKTKYLIALATIAFLAFTAFAYAVYTIYFTSTLTVPTAQFTLYQSNQETQITSGQDLTSLWTWSSTDSLFNLIVWIKSTSHLP